MSVVVNETSSNYTIPNEGSYLGVVADVIDLGPTATAFGVKNKVQIVWLLDAYDEESGDQFRVSSFYNASLHEKSNLRKDLKQILGSDVSGSFDLETILGMNSQLVIQHNESDGKTYANIVAILKAPKGKKLEIPAEFERKIDRDGVGSSEKPVNTTAQAKGQRKAQPQLKQAAQPTQPTQQARPVQRRAAAPIEQVVEQEVEQEVEQDAQANDEPTPAPVPAPVQPPWRVIPAATATETAQPRQVARPGTIRQARSVQPATQPEITSDDIPF